MTIWISATSAVVGGYMAYKGAKDSAEAGADASKAAAQLIKEEGDHARELIFQMIPIGERNLVLGGQKALDILGESMGSEIEMRRGGNIAAQRTILAGLPQIHNALLGRDIDYSKFEVYEGGEIPEIDYQLPEFESVITDEMEVRSSGGQAGGVDDAELAEDIRDQIDITIDNLYMEVFGRLPDASGRAWAREKITDHRGLVAPGKVADLKKEMMKSDEYKNKHPAEDTTIPAKTSAADEAWIQALPEETRQAMIDAWAGMTQEQQAMVRNANQSVTSGDESLYGVAGDEGQDTSGDESLYGVAGGQGTLVQDEPWIQNMPQEYRQAMIDSWDNMTPEQQDVIRNAQANQ